jgi:TolB-like protein
MKKRPTLFILAAAGLLLFFSGCFFARETSNRFDIARTSDLIPECYRAADALAQNFALHATLLTTSFVNLHDLQETSGLGRTLSEQISSRLSQRGFRIREIKVSNESLFVKKGQGEFVLSRKLDHISQSLEADFVLVGTYSVTPNSVYVTSKIIDVKDHIVLKSVVFRLANVPGNDVWSLVSDTEGVKR